jgi:hypothetical protein
MTATSAPRERLQQKTIGSAMVTTMRVAPEAVFPSYFVYLRPSARADRNDFKVSSRQMIWPAKRYFHWLWAFVAIL